MPSRELKVEIIGDARSLQRALGNAADSSSRFGSAFSKMGKVVGLAALGAGAAVTAGFVYTLKRGFDELADSQKVMAQTGAVLKSTGGAANATTKDITGLAESLSAMSGVDDEVIQSGENMLLTFTNIRNEVGKGNDIFNQSTGVLLDMSTALGTDMNKSAIQLGKALNDPIKGITALTRVGVTFTEGQRETIKSMVESGNVMGAQKLILAELNREFGGSAKAFGETMPGQLAKLKNAFDEVAGNLAVKFLPILTSLVEWVNANWPTIETVINAVGTGIMATFNAIGVAVDYLRGQWEIHRESAIAAWNAVRDAVLKFIAYFQSSVLPAIRNVISAIMAIWNNFGGEIKTVVGAIVLMVTTTLRNMLAPIKIILALLRGDWSAAWNEIKGVVSRTLGAALSIIKALLGSFVSAAVAIGKGIVTGILNGLAGIAAKVGAQMQRLWDALKTAAATAASFAAAIGEAVVMGIYNAIKAKIGWLKAQIESLLGFLKNLSPFSSVEEGGAKYIGEPIMIGAAKGAVRKQLELKNALLKSVRDAVEAAQAHLAELQAGWASAFASLAEAGLAAIDKKFEDWTPPALRMLEKMRLEDEIKAVKDRVKSAMGELNALISESAAASQALQALGTAPPPGMDPEEWQKQVDAAKAVIAKNGPAIIAAQEVVNAALRSQREFYLQQEAIQQQAHHDLMVAKQKQRFLRELAEITEGGTKSKAEFEKQLKAIKKLFDDYNIKFVGVGKTWGSAIAKGLAEAEQAVREAAEKLAKAVADATQGSSPTKTGPLSKFDPKDVGYDFGYNFALGLRRATGEMASAFKTFFGSVKAIDDLLADVWKRYVEGLPSGLIEEGGLALKGSGTPMDFMSHFEQKYPNLGPPPPDDHGYAGQGSARPSRSAAPIVVDVYLDGERMGRRVESSLAKTKARSGRLAFE